MSAANSSGIFRREPSTAAFWASSAPAVPTPFISTPMRPARISVSRVWALRILTSGFISAIGGRIMSAKQLSCPAFSSMVIWASRASTRSEPLAAARLGATTANPAKAVAPASTDRRLGPDRPSSLAFNTIDSL